MHVKGQQGDARGAPRDEDVNECWLADRDRFLPTRDSNTPSAMTQPMVKATTASGSRRPGRRRLNFVADRLKAIPAGQIGALSTP